MDTCLQFCPTRRPTAFNDSLGLTRCAGAPRPYRDPRRPTVRSAAHDPAAATKSRLNAPSRLSLPASLAWVSGGGRVKRFALDFAGAPRLEVPVVVTREIRGRQLLRIEPADFILNARDQLSLGLFDQFSELLGFGNHRVVQFHRFGCPAGT